MITRSILEAQRDLYLKARQEATVALERVQANVSALNGAIKACGDLLRVVGQMEFEAERSTPDGEDDNRTEVTHG